MFIGRHTAENIQSSFDNILRQYNLSGRVSYIVSDNAANMAKAFSVKFPVTDHEAESLLVEDDSLWDTDDPEDVISGAYPDASHIRCYAHTLQLTVKDGMKHIKPLYGVMGKTVKVCSLLHTSTTFKVMIFIVC